jgi:formiminotetrahydrofolate cyclodeaminase
MVARLTIGKKKYEAVEGRMQEIAQQADDLGQKMRNAVVQDAQAFQAVMNALRMPKETAEQQQARKEALQAATLHAATVPLEVARGAVAALQLAAEVVAQGNLNAISDGGSAAAQALAALRGAALNVRINVQSFDEGTEVKGLLDELAALETRATVLWEQIKSCLRERAGLEVG